MTAQVLIIIPVVERPHRAAPVVDSIRRATPEGAYRILFVGNPGDEPEHEAVRATGEQLIVIDRRRQRGDYQRKINTAHRCSTEPLLFLGADDLDFRPGWFEAVQRVLDTGARVVGTNDLGNPRVIRGEHATHCVVTRRYVDEFGTIDRRGYVLHEEYDHEFCDDELVGTAKKRGVWAFAEDAVVEHLHPHWSHPDGTPKAETDHLYAAQQQRMRRSRQVYNVRRHLWER